jgi:indolepyruvate decarboxylase
MMSKKDDQDLQAIISRRNILKTAGIIGAGGAQLLAGSSAATAASTDGTPETNITGHPTVAQYLLGRLKDLGVEHTFGVPGDFIYDTCDAVQDDPDIKGIWCANELNAGYAADGYARTRGVGVSLITYGAEFSAFNAVAGANAERSKVVFITGIPSFAEMQTGGRMHHMIQGQNPDGYALFNEMAAPLTSGGDCAVVMTAKNCVYETERLIASMLYHSLPVYISIPRLEAHTPVVLPKTKLNIPLANPVSDPVALKEVVSRITSLIDGAKRPALLPGYLVRRHNCVEEMLELVNASGLPFYTGKQDKAVLSEQHPQFGGAYMGQWVGIAEPEVTKYLDSSDCLIGIGPENHSFNNAFHTMAYELKDTINIMPHMTRIGMANYANVEMKDVLTELARQVKKRTNISAPKKTYSISTEIAGSAGDAITYEPLYQRWQAFLKPNDIVVEAVAVASLCGAARATFPDGVDFEGQGAFGQLGWATAAMIGAASAAPDRRCIILDGEGGQQMTANELGVYARYGMKNPIYITVNNHGYLGERVTNRYPDEEYNDTAPWDFAALPGVLGCKDWYTEKVTTLGELDAALAKASKATSGVYIEVIVDKWELPRGAEWLYSATGAYFGMAGRKWSDWMKMLPKRNKA